MAKKAKIEDKTNLIERRNACLSYFDKIKRFLDEPNAGLPDATDLCELRPTRSFKSAKVGEDADGRYVAAMIDHRNVDEARLFDPWWFAIMRWLELPGGYFRFNKAESQGKDFFYVTYMLAGEGNYSLRRIVVNTPAGRATPELADHYDYRRINLKTEKAKPFIKRTNFKMNMPYRERNKFLRFVEKMLKKTLSPKRLIPGLEITRTEYVRRLGSMFELADAVHERVHPSDQERQ